VIDDRRVLRVALADLGVTGVSDTVVSVFTDSLLAEVRKLQRTSVIGMAEVRAMLDMEAARQIAGCADEESCLAELAGSLGADVLLVGTIADLGDATALSLKRIDQRSGTVVGQVNQRLKKARGEELLAAIGPAVAELFVDMPLRPGQTRGVAKDVALRLNPPPLPVAAFWTGVGITAGGALASATAGGLWASSHGAWRAALEDARNVPTEGRTLKAQESNVVTTEIVMWSLLGTTTAAAIATAVLVPFVDWDGADP
jgi:hypothetical protein